MSPAAVSRNDRPVTVSAAAAAVGGAFVDEPSRRSILKTLGAAGLTVLVTGTGAISYRAFDNGVLDAGSGTPYDARRHWDTDPSPLGAVAAAILAANPHNTQPWRFHVTADTIDLFSDPTRQMPQVDPLRREHHIGLGCALENLVLAAGARGHQSRVTLQPDPADPAHLARVALTSGARTSSPLYDAVGHRHSNRGPYTSASVGSADLEMLTSQNGGLPGVAVTWFDSPADRATLSTLILDATRAFIADRKQSQEAFAWLRNDRDQIDRHRDGPTLDAQGLDPLTLTLAKLLPASSRTAGDNFWLTQTEKVHTATAAAYGVITVPDPDDVVQRLNGGRLLQRIHLAVTGRGIALQHMNQVTERIDADQVAQRAPTLATRFAALLGQPERSVLCTMRIGIAERDARLSPRRSLRSVIV